MLRPTQIHYSPSDGVDVVFACSLGGSQPSALQAVRPSDTNPNTAFAYVFVRASAGTPNPAVADWIGKCTANAIGKQYFCTNGLCDTLLTQDWCVMCQGKQGEPTSKRMRTDHNAYICI